MYKLIIVDDEKLTRESLKNYVDWQSLRVGSVRVARNGIEALALAEEDPPDLVLTDVRMPKMDGLELAERLRSSLPRCRIIFLSGYADKEYLKRAIQLRAIDYIEKPVRLQNVSSAIASAVADCRIDPTVPTSPMDTEICFLLRIRIEDHDWEGVSEIVHRQTTNQLPPDGVATELNAGEVESYMLRALSDAIEQEIPAPRIDDQISGRNTGSIVGQSFGEMMRLLRGRLEQTQETLPGRRDVPPKVREARRYLQARFCDPLLNLQTVADHVGLSKTYLSALFKSSTGSNLNDYVTRLRVERSKDYLVDVTAKTYEVAARVGFTDANYFSSIFRRAVGASPSEFRTRGVRV